VFKWLLNTKHSGSGRPLQGFFVHRKGVQKQQEKQPSAAIPMAYPRGMHRLSTTLSTKMTADERHCERCSFTTARQDAAAHYRR
jgi:hypothetical protein